MTSSTTQVRRSVTVSPVRSIKGDIELPGDKSIAHRAVIFGALAHGESLFENFPNAQDPQTSIACMNTMGMKYEFVSKTLWVRGKGHYRLKPPSQPLDAGNSGTTMRILAGLLSGQNFSSVITGDEYLLKRPMRRIIKPLQMMNAKISGTRKGTAPLKIGAIKRPLKSMNYLLPVASAQVKTAVLLAGIFAMGTTTVIEPVPTRDHTERMLNLPIKEFGGKRYISVDKHLEFPAVRMTIPGDPSTAAFFIVAALITADSELVIKNMSLNPTRAAFLNVLKRMNADIEIFDKRESGSEPMGSVRVRSSKLRGCSVDRWDIPLIIDEIPILSVAGACADGVFNVRDAGELRYKESDRIRATVDNLTAMGIRVEEREDGFSVEGGRLRGGTTLDSFGDHRIAMASVVAALAADDEITVHNSDAANVSFPGFMDTLESVTRQV
jgi:3-phosphoshikimate 1-carboxyvinyltransferase